MDDPRRLDLEIRIDHPASATCARVAPNRGGMVTTFEVRSRPIFFLDRESFVDPAKNVRGGSPVLFPTPGKLEADAWSRDGARGSLKQHGFARSLPWAVIAQRQDAVTLRLDADETTRASYPWDFRVELTYRVNDRALFTSARIENRGEGRMPFGFGFHPYFAVRSKGTFEIDARATRAFDNVTKREVAFDRRRLEVRASEIDLHLLDHTTRGMSFVFDEIPCLTIDGSKEYSHWVLWSLPGRDFVCVEPWTCPGNAMNTGDRLIHLAPGKSTELELEMRVEAR